MRTSGVLVMLSVAFVVAAWLVVSGWRQPRPLLESAVRRLRRQPSPVDPSHEPGHVDLVAFIGAFGARTSFVTRRLGSLAALRIIGRPLNLHVGYLIVAAIAGLVLPSIVFALLSLAGIVSLGVLVPAGLSLLGLTTSGDAHVADRYTLYSIAGVILGGGEFIGGRVSP